MFVPKVRLGIYIYLIIYVCLRKLRLVPAVCVIFPYAGTRNGHSAGCRRYIYIYMLWFILHSLIFNPVSSPVVSYWCTFSSFIYLQMVSFPASVIICFRVVCCCVSQRVLPGVPRQRKFHLPGRMPPVLPVFTPTLTHIL